MVMQTEMNGYTVIRKLKTPSLTDDAVNKGYVDINFLNKNGGSMTGLISMNNNKITDIGLPTSNNDAVDKEYVDTNFLKKQGFAIRGDLSMNNYRITSLSPPTDNNDAATKQFIINSSSNIYLYGSVDNRGIVNFNNFDLRIGNIHIISFGVLTNNSYNRIGDSKFQLKRFVFEANV